jgi:phosphatidylglycerol:prolipoprotein diacylglycerol transferase
MRQTLFHISQSLFDAEPFAFAWLFGIWVLFAGIYLGYEFFRRGWNGDLQAGLVYAGIIGAVIVFGLPRLAEAEGIPVRGYGLMMLIAVTCSVALAIHRARQVGLADDVIYSLAMWMILPGIIGARIFFVIEYRGRFFKKEYTLGESLVKAVSLQEGGLVVFGSLIGAVLGLLAFSRVYRLPLLPLTDVSVPSMALGQAIGRIGCLFNGCCFGGECDLPWQMTFPDASPPYFQQLEKGKLLLDGMVWELPSKQRDVLIVEKVQPNSAAEKLGFKSGQRIVQLRVVDESGKMFDLLPVPEQDEATLLSGELLDYLKSNQQPKQFQAVIAEHSEPIAWTLTRLPSRSLPIHPTQIYSAIDAFILCGFLLAWIPFRKQHGELLALTLILHSISRFMLEDIRTDESSVFGTGLSISQNISVAMFLVGGCLLGWINRGPQRQSLRVQRV